VPGEPTGLTATAAGDNRIDLAWVGPGPDADSFNVYRAIGSCPQAEYELIASGISGTGYADLTVSGGLDYSYVVTSKDITGGCESAYSVCADAQTTGACLEAPAFDGVQTVTNPGLDTCTLDLSWNPADPYCGSSVSYNVYRSTTSGFTPSPGNRIASGVSGTSYADAIDIDYGSQYFYVVRAVDLSNGSEDGNTVEAANWPTGPIAIGTWFDDAGDTDPAVLTLELPWHAADSGGSAGPKVYQTGAYSSDTCAAAATPELLLGPSPTLEFWSRYDIEGNWDKGIVEISANGGSSWTRLEVGYPGYAGNTGDQCGLPTGTYFTGTDMTYDAYTASLAPWSGQEVIIRWRLSSDGYVEETGWWIDDISITDVSVPGECSSESPFVFDDGFESGDTTEWSTVGP
jgi:hypothetical protein